MTALPDPLGEIGLLRYICPRCIRARHRTDIAEESLLAITLKPEGGQA